ncbi:glycosyltransferase involved in cell wall biosynthesis [Dysgonomonadaceae bacterium PH5-43]|nr:glycosyltransferase involved in cell wall biosynthesis [Dysgonomonadaceae bacterium PH5-43]
MNTKGSILVSTITLAYNVEPYIEDAINSICNQSYSHLEIIIVINGCSLDNTKALVEKISLEDDRIKLVYNTKNSVIGDGRMIGLGAVKGDYFMFLDGDDMLSPNAIQSLLASSIENKTDIVIGSIQRMTKNGNLLEFREGRFIFDVLSPINYIPISFDYIDTYLHGKLYKSSILKNDIVILKDNSLGEDKMLHLQFSAYADRIGRCTSVVHYFRDNPSSITKKLKYQDFEGEFRNMIWLGSFFDKLKYLSSKQFLYSYKTHHLYILYYCLFTGNSEIINKYPKETKELLQSGYLNIPQIRNYLLQWPLYVPTLEIYKRNKYLGVCFTTSLQVVRKCKNKINVLRST